MDSIKRSIFVLAISIFLLLINIQNVEAGGCYAFGVSSLYWPGNPLQLAPGQSNSFSLAIQNVLCDNDLLVLVIPIEGSEYVEVTDESYLPEYNTTYYVPAGNIAQSHITASVPLNASVGDVYPLSFQFFSALPTNKTPIFYSHLIINFDIVVVEPPKETCPADLNSDDIVDETDFDIFLAGFGTSGPGDFNNDGIVDSADFFVFLAEWGECDITTTQLIMSESIEIDKSLMKQLGKKSYRKIGKEHKELREISLELEKTSSKRKEKFKKRRRR